MTDAQKIELAKRKEAHLKGISKSYTWEEVKQIVISKATSKKKAGK